MAFLVEMMGEGPGRGWVLLGSSGAHFPAPLTANIFRHSRALHHTSIGMCASQDNTAVKTEVSGSDTISGDKEEPAGAPTLHLGSQTKVSFLSAVRVSMKAVKYHGLEREQGPRPFYR